MMISRSPLSEFSFTLEGGPKAAESRRKEPGSASQNQTPVPGTERQTTDRKTDRLLTDRMTDRQREY